MGDYEASRRDLGATGASDNVPWPPANSGDTTQSSSLGFLGGAASSLVVLGELESQLEKVEAAIALVQDLELSSGAADSPRAGDSGSLEAKRSSRPSLAGRASENGGAQSNNDAAADGPESLSSILAADAAIALSLLASRVPPPPTPEPFLSGPGSTGSVVGAAHLSSTGGFAPAAGPVPTTTVAMPPLRDAAPDVAPGPPADDNGAPELSAGTAAQRRDAEASQPADQGDGRGAAFRFIHPDSPSAAAAAAVLRGAGSFEPAASTSSSHAQGSPRAGPAVPGPPQAADSASSNILFAVMNALCAPPPNPDDSHAETRDSSIPCSSGSEARLVSGGDDGTVRVWRVGGGEPGMVMRGHKGPVCSLVVLPNGRLASGSADKTIIIWRLSTGKLERTLKGHTHTVCALACFNDDRLISGSEDCMVRVWNSDPGACLVTLAGHTNTVTGVASVTNWVIVSSSGDSTLRVWNLNTSSCIQVLRNHTGLVRSVIEVTSNRHRWLVSGAADRTVKVWKRDASTDGADAVWAFFENLTTGGDQGDGGKLSTSDTWTCVSTLSHPSPVQGLAALGDNSFLTVSEGTVRVWRLEDAECAREVNLGSAKSAVTACPKEGWAAFGAPSGVIEVWDYLGPGQGSPLLARTLEGHEGPVRALEYILADWRLRVRTACYF